MKLVVDKETEHHALLEGIRSLPQEVDGILIVPLFLSINHNFNVELVRHMELTKGLKKKTPNSTIYTLAPYMPYSRQDESYSLFLGAPEVTPIIRILHLMRKYGTECIVTLELHCDIEAEWLIDLHIEDLIDLRTAVIGDAKTLVAPDIGAYLRCKRIASLYGLEFAVIGKQRTSEGEIKSLGLMHGQIKGDEVLLLDDIVDSGRTLIQAVKAIQQPGIRVKAFAVHCLLTQEELEGLLDHVAMLYVSNSIEHKLKHPRLITLDLAPGLIAKLTELFDK